MLRRSPFDIRRFRLAVDYDLLTPLPCPKQNPGKQTDNHTHTHIPTSAHTCTFPQPCITTVTPAYTCTHTCSEVHTHTHTQSDTSHLDEKCSEEFLSEGLAWKASAWRVGGQGGLGQSRLSVSSKGTKGPGNSFHRPKEVLAAMILGIVPLARANEFGDWTPDTHLS